MNYAGNTQSANVDKNNAAYFAGAVISARATAVIAESLWVDTTGLSGSVNQTVTGSNGGTATITGSISGNTGWLDITFASYSEGSGTVDGRYIQRLAAPAASSGGFLFSQAGPGNLEFDDLLLTVGGQSLELRGAMTVSGGNFEKANLDLLVTEPSSGDQIYYQDLVIDYTGVEFRGTSLWAEALSGVVYDSALGSVTVSALEPFTELDIFEPVGYLIAHRGGRIRIESAGNTVEFASLSRAWGALEIDTDGDGVMDEALRISWGALAGLPEIGASARSGPIANAGDEILADVGNPATIHALFSHDDDGDWLNFEWQILTKPLNSSLVLTTANAATQTFVPDVEGQYLFAVTVSDGVEATRTTVKLTAALPGPSLRDARTHTGGLEVAASLDAATPIVIDGRSSMNLPYVPGFGSWWVDGPSNWTLTELESPQKQAFFAASNGIYEPNFSESATAASYLNTYNYVKFAVGLDLPTTEVAYYGDTNARTIVLADYDGDGLDDLVVGVASFMNVGVRVIRNLGGGNWQMGPQADGPNGEIAVGDLNNDGRMDIAVSGNDGVSISYQQADGTPGDMVTELYPAAGCTLTGSNADIGIGDINGDDRDDLFAVVICSNSLAVWRQDDVGGLDSPTLELPGEQIRFGSFVDVNGDGRTDALLGLWGSSPDPAQAVIALAQADGTLSIDERFDAPLSNVPPAVSIANITGDALDDVVLVGTSYLTVHERQQDGSTSQSVQQTLTSAIGIDAFVNVLDVDGDGDSDILMCAGASKFVALMQTSQNVFEEIELSRCVNELNGLPNGFAIVDFNGDGSTDIVLGGQGGINQSQLEALFQVMIGDARNYASSP
ncbi:MAG TPA: FG-GAP-like repeat-containing protein [Woeseiaceae bacterium]|nr:FG-GAP-like repeat-containing protein [Woeseiaceae bacterium]